MPEEYELEAIDDDVANSAEVLGKECAGCTRVLAYKFYDRDSSYTDGRKPLCCSCASVPKLSINEHTARMREKNLSSYQVKQQQWENQEDDLLGDEAARLGRPMSHSDFLYIAKQLIPNLYVTEGNFQDELAIYVTYPCGQPDLDGRDFRYLCFSPTGLLPEFSQYEIDTEKNIPIKESRRGWRTLLLRFIGADLVTESTVNKVFGPATGPASERYNRQLWKWRNKK